MSTAARTDRGETTLNQKVALAFGAIYILVGILGFFFTDQFIGEDTADTLLGIFGVNHLHNIVHLLIGVVLVGAGRAGDRQARSMNATIGAVYLLLGIVGWFLKGDLNFVNLNAADHILHLLSGAVLFGVSRADARTNTTTRTA